MIFYKTNCYLIRIKAFILNLCIYFISQSSKETAIEERLIQELMTYYDDWLLPELAGDILRIAFTDESGKITPKNKVDAFRILQSKYSKHLKFGTTLGEDYHPIIVKHLQELYNSSSMSKVEVFKNSNLTLEIIYLKQIARDRKY